GEHDAQVTERVHGGAAVIGDHSRHEESGQLEPAVTVRRTHHGNLDAHATQSRDAIGPVSLDGGPPLELEAKFGEERNGGIDVFHHNAHVVHTLDRHDVSLAGEKKEKGTGTFFVAKNGGKGACPLFTPQFRVACRKRGKGRQS